jgi:hypothetical protein
MRDRSLARCTVKARRREDLAHSMADNLLAAVFSPKRKAKAFRPSPG